MLVIGHTVPAIYALGHNGVEMTFEFQQFSILPDVQCYFSDLGKFSMFFPVNTGTLIFNATHSATVKTAMEWKETK